MQHQHHVEAPSRVVVGGALPGRLAEDRAGGLADVVGPVPTRQAMEPLRLDTADAVPSEQLWRAAIRVTREAAELAADLRRQVAAERMAMGPVGEPRVA